MNSRTWEIRRKLQKKKQKEGFKKICHLCKKELIIKPEDTIFMMDDKSVHYECFRKRVKK